MAVDRTERLLNLVFALMAGSRPVTRSVVQRTVPGYGVDQSESAFERMFERDKDELRSMGIPVETVVGLDGEVEGYRIPRDEYALETLEFTAAELAVVALAASVWQSAVLGPSAVTAVRKIEAAQGVETPVAEHHVRVQVAADDAALLPLMRALREGTQVAFEYRSSVGESSRRVVDPWGIVSAEGHWYLVAWDPAREGERVFRLSRMSGVVVRAQHRSQLPSSELDLAAVVRGYGQSSDETYRVRVAASQGAALRRMAAHRPDDTQSAELDIIGVSRQRVIGAVCAAGAAAELVDPPEVRLDVIAALRKMVVAHG